MSTSRCHPTISSSVAPFSASPFPASGLSNDSSYRKITMLKAVIQWLNTAHSTYPLSTASLWLKPLMILLVLSLFPLQTSTFSNLELHETDVQAPPLYFSITRSGEPQISSNEFLSIWPIDSCILQTTAPKSSTAQVYFTKDILLLSPQTLLITTA